VTTRTRRILAQLGSFALAGVLLYLALRGVDLDAVANALREADYRWIVPLGVITLLSHLLRAWRWQVLLEALPPKTADAPPPSISLKVAFYSVMIGYMVNYAAPRMGEVARTANLAAQHRLSFSGVFGTVVVERILDALVLLIGLVSAFFLLIEQSAVLQDLFINPIREQLGRIPALALVGLLAGLILLILILQRSFLRREDSRLRQLWSRRVQPLWISFKDGLATVLRSPRRIALVGSTLGIWLCYLLMAYIPFQMFNFAGPYDLSLPDTWSIMMLGAVGVAIPSPGGIGSFHYITIQTLTVLFGVDHAGAASYAVFVHGGQMLLYIVVGFVCILLQGSSLGSLRKNTQAASQEREEATAHDASDASPTTTQRHDRTPQGG